MTVSYSKHYDLLGKYVSFYTDNLYPHIGIVDSVSFYLDGRIEISFDTNEFYDLSQVSKFEILGAVNLFESPIPFSD